MHFQRKGLQGEDMLDDYKLQNYLGLIPDVLRHMLAPIVSKLFGERDFWLIIKKNPVIKKTKNPLE